MHTSAAGSRDATDGSATGGDTPRYVGRPATHRHGRLFRLTASGLATTVVAGMLSVVAVAAALTATPEIASAATTGVAATWSTSPSCTGYVTATPPAGTVSATVTINGAGGGGGQTNSGSGGTGGSGGQITGTLPLTHNLGIVSTKLGCGGGGGSEKNNSVSSSSVSGGAGGSGFGAGAAGGGASASVSVDGESSGGGGGGATGLCLGNGACTTPVAVAGGGGGGGARWDCTGSAGPGAGGSGQSGGTGTTSAGGSGSNSGDASNGVGGGGGTSSGGGGGGNGSSHSGSGGGNTPWASSGGTGGAGNGGEAGTGGGGGGGGYTGGGGGGGDSCTSGLDASGGGGGGSSAVAAGYTSGISYNGNGGAGAGTGGTGGAGSITLTWNVDNLSVTNPGTQSSVSGTAVSGLTISSVLDTTGGNAVTYSASGLPAGLSISSGGVVSGTPTTPCACAVTVTATDSQALTATTSFTWNVTNTVTVTNPGNKSAVTGTAITAVTSSATDSQAGATLSWSATGLPTGLSVNSSTGSITGTPTAPCSCSVTLKATDGAGYFGTTSFTWTVTNTVTVTNPGNKSAVTGTAITAVTDSATDSQSGASFTWSATGLPAGLSVNSSTGSITGTPTAPCTCSVTLKATDGAGFSGTTAISWTVTNTVAVANPGSQTGVTGSPITTLTNSATDSQSGVSAFTWSATGLPAGLSINTGTGAVTGTPTAPGTSSVSLTATDASGQSGTATFTWTVTNTVTVTNPGNKSAVTGSAITAVSNSATDSQSGQTFTWSATGLPAGLSVNSSTGSITGTPTAPCTCSVVITATDGAGYSGTTSISWTVTNTVAVTNPGNRTNVTGSAITTLANSATDSQTGVSSFTWSATGLPAGLSISTSTGTISGTPTAPCACSITLTATDLSGQSGTATFTWTVTNSVTVTSPGTQHGTSGTPVSAVTPSASDSQSGATFTWTASGLPAGLSINGSTGTISGTPTAAGTSPVTVTATDGAGFAGSATFSWAIANTVTVAGHGAQSSTSGTAVSALTNGATDSQAGETYTWTASGLPTGLSIDPSTGTISGTPATAGVSSVTVTATDGAGFAGSTSFAWTVTNAITVAGPGDRSDVSGSAISQLDIGATDSSPTATPAFSATGLPAGLTIDVMSGAIAGTPTTACTCSVTVTVTDGSGASGAASFTWTITNVVVVSDPGNQSHLTGSAVSPLPNSATDTSSGASLTWSATGLPAGLSIDGSTGTVTGTPTTACTCSVTLSATDGSGASGSTTFAWTITNSVSVATPADRSDGSGSAVSPLPNSATDTSSGASLTWSATGLPAGLSIDGSTGTVTGTPTTACTCSVTLSATDGSGASGSTTFVWTITNTVDVADPGSQSHVSGSAVGTVTASASDSSSTASIASWSATGLPPGLSIGTSSGTMSGTPTTAGSYAVTLTASDSAGYRGTRTFDWTITNAVSVTDPGARTSATGSAISPLAVTATDSSSTAALSFAASGLPAGLSIDPADGTVSGTPTTPGSSSVTVTATDDAGYSGSATFTWSITNAVVVTGPGDRSDLSGAPIAPVAASATDSQSGATLTWSATGLPAELSIDHATGTVTGTPTTACTCSVTLTATDGSGASASASLTWTVTNTVSLGSPGDQADPSGAPVSGLGLTATDTSSTATLTYAATGLPAGLSIDHTTGVISGTPTTAGTSSVTVTATDGSGATDSATFSWTITNTVSVTSPGDRSDLSGSAITPIGVAATDTSSTATLTFGASGLPTGLSIDGATGAITGTPTTAGTSPVTVTATDGSGATDSATFAWTITNTVSVDDPGARSDPSGAPIGSLAASASDSSSTATLTWSATGLPAGLSIDHATGTVTGTPTTACTCSVTRTATDDAGFSDSASFTWTITNAVSVTSPGDRSDLSGSAIAPVTVAATDSSSTATLTWSATGLPAGLSIDGATGVISGTPTTAGTSSVTVTASDGSGASDSATFSWSVTNTVAVTSPGDRSDLSGSAIAPVTVAATDSSSTATLTWSATGLPAGLSIDGATGVISGTPTTAGTSSVTVTATDGSGAADSATFSWTVSDTLALTNPGNRSDDSGTAISPVTLSAADTSSTATLTYSDGGTLPAGLSLDGATGVVSGTPTTGGAVSVALTVSDGSGATATVTFTWTIVNVVTSATTGAQSDVAGAPISTLDASATDSSPVATLSYSDGGTLPPGLSVDPATGAVTGTPTTGGSFPVVVTAADDAGYSATDSFTWVISDVVTTTGPGAQSNVSGTAVSPVTATATDSSSTAVVTWADSGTLPPGLSVGATTGAVTGTPTTAGTYAVTLTATDGAGYSDSTSFTWTITNVVTAGTVASQSNRSGTAISPLGVSATDSSPVATLSYSDGGTLPPGLSVDSGTGSVTGTPTTAGTYSVAITATDDAGFTGTSTFTWTVTNVVSVGTPASPTSASGSPITPLTLTAHDTSTTATITSWSATRLPTGLSIDPSSGAISGTPTTGGNYFDVIVTAVDSAGFSGSTHFEWQVVNVVTVAPLADQSTGANSPATPVTPSATDSQVTPPATFTWSATGLPAGITVNHASGQLSGTPTTAGTYGVTVTAKDNSIPPQSGSASFTWTVTNVAPVVTGVAPTSGPGAGGTAVKVTGTNLQGATAVDFGGTAATIKSINGAGTQVSVTSPAHVTGTVDITVVARGLTSTTSTADQFTYAGPLVTKLTPASGPTAGGGKVKIKGTGLKGATSVTFGSTPATGLKVNKAGTQITVTAPAHVVGAVTVTVTTPGGSSAATSADLYTYKGPSVTALAPSSGPAAGGTTVTISGAGFKGATGVSFGSTQASGFTVNSAGTKITVTAPAGTQGTVDVTVATPGATSPVVSTDRFTYS